MKYIIGKVADDNFSVVMPNAGADPLEIEGFPTHLDAQMFLLRIILEMGKAHIANATQKMILGAALLDDNTKKSS